MHVCWIWLQYVYTSPTPKPRGSTRVFAMGWQNAAMAHHPEKSVCVWVWGGGGPRSIGKKGHSTYNLYQLCQQRDSPLCKTTSIMPAVGLPTLQNYINYASSGTPHFAKLHQLCQQWDPHFAPPPPRPNPQYVTNVSRFYFVSLKKNLSSSGFIWQANLRDACRKHSLVGPLWRVHEHHRLQILSGGYGTQYVSEC